MLTQATKLRMEQDIDRLNDALIICTNALRELTSNENVYDDINDKSISFDELEKIIRETY